MLLCGSLYVIALTSQKSFLTMIITTTITNDCFIFFAGKFLKFSIAS